MGNSRNMALLLKQQCLHSHGGHAGETLVCINIFWVHPSAPPPSNRMADPLAFLHGNLPAAAGSRAQTGTSLKCSPGKVRAGLFSTQALYLFRASHFLSWKC